MDKLEDFIMIEKIKIRTNSIESLNEQIKALINTQEQTQLASSKRNILINEDISYESLMFFIKQVNHLENKGIAGQFRDEIYQAVFFTKREQDPKDPGEIISLDLFYSSSKELDKTCKKELKPTKTIFIPDYESNKGPLTKALFLDRDGIININTHYPHIASELQFIEQIIPIAKHFSENGFKIIVTTNQSGIGRGYFKFNDYKECCERIDQFFEENNLKIEDWYHSPFISSGIDGYNFDSLLRKPSPGMFLLAASKHHIDLESSLMIGDSLSDQIKDIPLKCFILGEKSPSGLNFTNFLNRYQSEDS